MGTTGSGTGTAVASAATSLQTVIDAARYKLGNYEQPYLWSDAELVNLANECMRKFCFETRILKESTDTSICNLSLVDGTQDYAISDRIIQVRRARINGESRNLEVKSFEEMDDEHPDWRGDTEEGTPTHFISDWQHEYVSFWPIPEKAYTCYLRVYRIHKTDFTTTSMGSQTLEIPEMYASAIAEGITAKALLKTGEATYDPQKSQVHWAIFNSEIAAAKLMKLQLNNKLTYNKPHKGFY